MNISEAVRKVLAKYPHLEEYMSLGVINARALARAIFKDVKRELGGEANFQSVVTAVRRFPTAKKKPEKNKVLSILSRSDVNLRYDMGALTIKLDARLPRKLEEINRRLRGKTYMLIQGIETVTIVAEENILPAFEDVFKGSAIDSRKNLASIVVRSPKEIAATPGVIAYLANALALERINVIEMMSSFAETCFIVAESDALKGIEVIRGEIKRARG